MCVFNNSRLIYQGTYLTPMDIPNNSYVYWPESKEWLVKNSRAAVRPLPNKHVPKELKVLCLIHNIPL